IARRLGALVNILPLHPGGAPDLAPTPPDRIRRFAVRLRNQGIEATVRRSRGLDIDAACGQLRVKTEETERTKQSRGPGAWRRDVRGGSLFALPFFPTPPPYPKIPPQCN